MVTSCSSLLNKTNRLLSQTSQMNVSNAAQEPLFVSPVSHRGVTVQNAPSLPLLSSRLGTDEELPVSANRRGENLDEQPAVANQSRPRVCLIHAQGRVMRRVGASCVWGGGGENHNNRGQISVKAAI